MKLIASFIKFIWVCPCWYLQCIVDSARTEHKFTWLQWNIERGYELNAVIDQLQQLDADIIALQEVDIGCERSGWEDTGVSQLHLQRTTGFGSKAASCALNYGRICVHVDDIATVILSETSPAIRGGKMA